MLSEEVVFQYKCDNFYHPESEGTIAWNDIDLNISWRIPLEDVVSVSYTHLTLPTTSRV